LDLALALVSVLLVGGAGYYVVRFNRGPVGRALRLALWCVISGLALYLAYALRMPGAAWLREQGGVVAAGWVTLSGGAVPLVITWIADQGRKAESEAG
jgi:hypothetical protein